MKDVAPFGRFQSEHLSKTAGCNWHNFCPPILSEMPFKKMRTVFKKHSFFIHFLIFPKLYFSDILCKELHKEGEKNILADSIICTRSAAKMSL